MKKTVLILGLILSFNAHAASSGTCGTRSGEGTDEDPYVYADNCNWTLDESGKLTITGTGEMGDFEQIKIGEDDYITSAPWGTGITSVTVGDGITSIGKAAFDGAKNLSTVDGMNDVEKIKSQAFAYSGLTSISLPDSLTSIENSFSSCHNLSEVNLPNSLTSIPRALFWDTINLSSLTIPSSVTTLEFAAFDGSHITSLIVPATVTTIETAVFAHTPNLTSLVIEGNPEMIGDIFYAIGQEYNTVWGNTTPLTIYCLAEAGCEQKAEGTKANVTEYTKYDNRFYQIDDKLYATADLMTHGAACDNAQNCQDILDAASQGKSFEVGGKYYATLDLFANKKSCENQSQCEEMLSASKQNAPFIVGGRFYHSLDDFLTGNYEKKRIYTIEEAEKLSKKTGNTFKLRYK
ncbi:MAG: leucine-rich repeat domain-containing protein [Alphaproteobacteria bacterium]|nr:leucine-rich repeat domain-containing protein [Alphaproteobacteria bacterium]